MSAQPMRGRFARAFGWMVSRKHPDVPRWSPTKTLNIVCGTTIAWMLLWMFVGSHWHLGVEAQSQGCLPWRYFIVTTNVPATIVKDQIYQYTSEGAPLMPNGIRIVKYAAGLPGDHVVVNAGGIFINGKYWGPLNAGALKRGHMTVSEVTKAYVIPEGKVLVLGTTDISWDGRYWGLINKMQITAKAYPLW